jgi:NADH-quinone oxidoreductase subunit G
MATVFVNGTAVDIGSDRLNCIQAAERAGVLIPHYCWHPALTVVASCRMCLVEVGEMKDGKPAMQPKVVPGCQTPVKDGTVVVTDSAKAKKAQADTLEGLLLNHPLDCPVCDKAGECKLQDFSYQFGRSASRMVDDKHQPPNKPHISSKITLFTDRCVMCSRCVRFTREISGTAELTVVNRGDHAEIDVFPGEPLENKLAGNVVDLCPVGALGSKDFLYKQRVWNLKTKPSVCPGCSTGCSIDVDANKDIVYRLRPRENPAAQGHFICDEGRHGYHYCNSAQRLARPQARTPQGLAPAPWADLLPSLRADLTAAAQAGPVAGVLSPFLTCEEAYLLASYLKKLSPQAKLALGPVPVVGADDTYPKDRRGRPMEPVKFTIRAEKCPNRRGVEEVLKLFAGSVTPFADLVRDAGLWRAVFVTGGYPTAARWLTAEQAAALAQAPLVVVQDLFASPLTEAAKYVLPAATFAEKDGTFVNHAGLGQRLEKAVNPPQECRTEAQVFSDLLQRPGLVHGPTLRAEVARAVPALAALAGMGRDGARLTLSVTANGAAHG